MDLPTRADVFAAGRRSIKIDTSSNPGTRINPVVVDVAGSDINLILGASSIMAEEIVAAFARCLLANMIATAPDDGSLDRLAYDRYGVRRKAAQQATVSLTLSRPTFSAGGGTVSAGTRVQTAGGSIFSLETDCTFGGTDLVGTPVVARAQIAGPSQNVAAGSLTRFVDGPFDDTIQVTNQEKAAGGADRESAPAFRARVAGYFLTVRRATLAAVQYGARTVPGVSIATALDVINPGDALPAGAGQVIVGDDNGNSSPDTIQAVVDELLNWRPIGIPVRVVGGVVRPVPVVWRIGLEDGADSFRVAAQVRAATVAVAQFLNPGQDLLRSALLAGARVVAGAIVRDDSLVAPVGDVHPTEVHEILRVAAEDVSFA
jgi:uncharacterized phage protein gp47/JayE